MTQPPIGSMWTFGSSVDDRYPRQPKEQLLAQILTVSHDPLTHEIWRNMEEHFMMEFSPRETSWRI